jgi:hypothetical protein
MPNEGVEKPYLDDADEELRLQWRVSSSLLLVMKRAEHGAVQGCGFGPPNVAAQNPIADISTQKHRRSSQR